MSDYQPVDASLVAERVGRINERLEAVATGPVTLIAITKRFGPEAIDAAIAAGVQDLGESYAQELSAKVAERPDLDVAWHFVGGIQRNKVRLVADVVDLWHSVSRLKVGNEIAKRQPGARVLVQVNAAGTEGQAGCAVAEAPELIEQLRNLELQVEGVMGIGAAGDEDATKDAFAALVRVATLSELPHVSAGMSGDWELAVREGATMIRLGTALFGPRS